jgi:HPt (histidine-containing phosphotransfer) domain-containing protein
MAPPTDDTPSVATYSDHEVITPPHRLRKAITPAPAAADDPVARAETALQELAGEFAAWMHAECERLEAARREVRREGMIKKAHNDLFRAAHDIKGEAATFGYPAVAPVADSLCRLLEHTPQIKRIPLAVVEQHVDAIRAIAREHIRADRVGVANALAQRLRDVTDEFLRIENIHRPDYLESIFAPPLVPDGAST